MAVSEVGRFAIFGVKLAMPDNPSRTTSRFLRKPALADTMKLTGGFLLALGATPFAQLACAQAADGGGLPSASRGAATSTRFADEDVTDVGVGDVHPIGSDEEEIGQGLVDSLEAGGQTTGEDSLFPLR